MAVSRVRAGDLRERVIVQRATTTADTQGGRTTTWSALATVPASVVPWETQQDEALRADALTAMARYRVWLRYRPDVTPTMRLSWTPYRMSTAKTLEIQAVSLRGRELLLLDCVEAPIA